jgi:hypothetical protein
VFPRAAMRVTGDVVENLRTADSGAGERKGILRQVRLAALQQAAERAGHDWHYPALPKVPYMRPSS